MGYRKDNMNRPAYVPKSEKPVMVLVLPKNGKEK